MLVKEPEQKDKREQMIVVYCLPKNIEYEVVLMDIGEKRIYRPFVTWLGKITSEKGYYLEHCLMLIDYLACKEGIPVWRLNEKSLENFLYKYYPQKVQTNYSQQKHLIRSIKMLITFMLEKGFKLDLTPGLLKLLDEKKFLKYIREERTYFGEEAAGNQRRPGISQ